MQPAHIQTNKPIRTLVVLLVWALVVLPIAPYAMAAMHDDVTGTSAIHLAQTCHSQQKPAMPDCPHCAGDGSAFACQCLDQLNPSQLASPSACVSFVSRAIALKRIDLFTPLPHSPIYRQDKPPRYSS